MLERGRLIGAGEAARVLVCACWRCRRRRRTWMAAAWWLAAHRWCSHGAGARATAEQQRSRELRARRRLGVASRRRVSGGGTVYGRGCRRRFCEEEEKQV